MKEHAWRWAALAALLCGTALAIADEQPEIKTPQKARIQFTNGRIFSGTLVALSDKEVEFQVAGAAKASKYKITTVKAIQTADDVYIYNADKRVFESQKAQPSKDNPTKDSPTKVQKGPDKGLDKGAVGAIQVVVVDATAEKKEAAIAEAQRAAVLQVVRALLDHRTFAAEEKTIKEKVLSELGPLVKGQRVVGKTSEQGKTGVRMAVAVDRRGVAERLKKAGMSVKDGPRGVATELPRAEDSKALGAEVLRDVLADMPLTLVCEARVAGIDDNSLLLVDVRLFTDLQAYAHVAARLHKILEVLKVDQQTFPVATEAAGPEPGRRRSALRIRELRDTFPTDKGGWVLWTVSECDPQATKMVWHKTLLGTDLGRSVSSLAGKPYLLVSALGTAGQVIGSELVPLKPWPAHSWGWDRIPAKTGAREQFVTTPVGLSMQALKENAQIDCSLEGKQRCGIDVQGTDSRLISGVVCSLLLLP
jgi:hypothetical protein